MKLAPDVYYTWQCEKGARILAISYQLTTHADDQMLHPEIPLHSSTVQGRDSNSQLPWKTNLISNMHTSGYL